MTSRSDHPDPHAILADIRRIAATVPPSCEGTYTLRIADAEALAEMACRAAQGWSNGHECAESYIRGRAAGTIGNETVKAAFLNSADRLAETRRKRCGNLPTPDFTASAATLDRVQRVAEVRARIQELVMLFGECANSRGEWWGMRVNDRLTALRRELAELGEEESRG